ncbi:hypothetical protein D3C87_650960 [compost metagenome]
MKITKDAASVKLRHIRKSANRRGYSCTLTVANVRLLMAETHCVYTGERFDGDDNGMSFDRIDNAIGYEPGNVIPVIAHANHLKSNYGIEELRNLGATNHKRHIGYINSVAAQIAKKDQKIQSRRKQIEDLQKLLDKDIAEMEILLVEQKKAETVVELDARDGEIYMKMAQVLESQKDLGAKYLTLWQRFKRVLTRYFGGNTLLTKDVAK